MAASSRDLPLLHQAAISNDAAGAARLLEGGAGVEETSVEGEYTPLHVAAEHGAVEVARVLLDAGAVVDAVDEWGNTPLWHAVGNAEGQGAMIMLLRAQGADPFHANGHGRTPVWFAQMLGQHDAAGFFSDLADPWGPGGPDTLYRLTEPSTVPERIAKANDIFSSFILLIVSYGFASSTDDFDVVFELIVNDDFTDGRYRYRFLNCRDATASALEPCGAWAASPENLSQDDIFTGHPHDLQGLAWRSPNEFMWHYRERHPMRYVEGSERAAKWNTRPGHEMHHVEIANNADPTSTLRLDIVFQDLRITQRAYLGYVGDLHELDDAEASVCWRCKGNGIDPTAHRYTSAGTSESLPCVNCAGSGENPS